LSPRHAISAMPVTATKARNPSNHGPISDCVNEWTEFTIPDRVRNVPRIVRQNVAKPANRPREGEHGAKNAHGQACHQSGENQTKTKREDDRPGGGRG